MKTPTILGLLILSLATITSQAATRDWTGTSSTDWFTSGNWSALPITGDTVRYGFGATLPPYWPDFTGDNSSRVPVNVTIATGVNAWHTNSSGIFTNSGRILLGNAAGIAGNWMHNGGDLNCALDIQLGNIASSLGYFYMNGGNVKNRSLNVGLAANTTGTFFMNGGNVTATTINIAYGAGSTGTLLVTTGDIRSTGNINIGNDANTIGTLNASGGNITAGSVLVISPATSSTGVVSLVNCNLTNGIVRFGQGSGAAARLAITNALLWCTTRFDLNNQFLNGAENTVIIGTGGILDTEGAEFYKGTVTLCTNGILRVRKQGGELVPLNARPGCPINFVGGEMWIGTNYTATSGAPNVARWIQNGSMITTLPGMTVLYGYDSGSGYTKIYAGEFPQGQPGNLAISESGGNFTLSWVDPTALYTLKSTTDLSAPNWNFVTNAVSVINTTNFSVTFTNDIAVQTSQFFRLSYS